MKTRKVGRGAMWAAAAGLLALSLPVLAQTYPNRGAQAPRRTAPRTFLNELRALADKLAARYQVKIVVDPAIIATSKPSAPSENLEVEAALTSLAGQYRNVAWRRVYLNRAQAGVAPSAERLADAVRALDRIEQTGLVVENHANKRAATFVRFNVPANFADELAQQQFSTEPIYILYNPAANTSIGAGRSVQERFADLQRQQMEMMMQMSPDEAAQAMAQGMQMWMNLDPQTRAQFMGTMMRAGMQMWQNMPPQMRQQMMGDIMQFGQQFLGQQGGPPVPPPPVPPGDRPPPPRP